MKKEKKTELLQDALQYLDEDMLEVVEKMRGGVVDKASKYEDVTDTEPIGSIKKKQEDKIYAKRQGEDIKEIRDTYQKKDLQSDTIKFAKTKKWTTLVASICIIFTVSWIWSGIFPQINSSDKSHEGIQESANLNNDSSDNDSSVQHTVAEDETIKDCAGNKEGEVETANIPSNESNGNDDLIDEAQSEEVTTRPSKPQSEALGGIEIPKMKVTLPREDAEIDMIGFFIYEGRCYVQNESMDMVSPIEDAMGDYIGTVKGSIDEWTKEDDYIDYTGSVGGEVYEIKGIDPKFMLCMRYDNEMIETYINNNGISLYKGSELINDRLHLKENYTQVSYFTSEEWNNTHPYQTQKQPTILEEEYRDVFDRFLDAFSEGVFQWKKDIIYSSSVENEYHLYFTTGEGIRLHFWLLGDGYVSFHGLNQVCVQIDETLYNEVIGILQP